MGIQAVKAVIVSGYPHEAGDWEGIAWGDSRKETLGFVPLAARAMITLDAPMMFWVPGRIQEGKPREYELLKKDHAKLARDFPRHFDEHDARKWDNPQHFFGSKSAGSAESAEEIASFLNRQCGESPIELTLVSPMRASPLVLGFQKALRERSLKKLLRSESVVVFHAFGQNG